MAADTGDASAPPKWRVRLGAHDIELAHPANPAAIHLTAGASGLELRNADGAWTMAADDLVPSRLSAVAFDPAPRVRDALLGPSPAAGATRVGDWLLWHSGDVIAFRHASWDWALATYEDGNGWLVSVGGQAVGFVPSSMLDRPDHG